MAFTANDVKNLREMTGVGMMDCKKALTETDGNMEKAIEYLREKGLASAQKKAGRIAAEGVCAAYIAPNGAAGLCEVNIETDFAAKNEDFKKFAQDVAMVVVNENPADLDALMNAPYPGGKTVTEALQELVLVIGENIKVRRFTRMDSGYNVSYIHMGGKIGVLINMEADDSIKDKVELLELGKDIAMQTAAMRPMYLDNKSVSQEEIDKEREIQFNKAVEENKEKNLPDDKARSVAENMVKGRMNKFFEETCLMNQPYVKENKISVEKHVAEVAKQLGASIKIMSFVRYETGEGIEKKSDNFAEEVANMIK